MSCKARQVQTGEPAARHLASRFASALCSIGRANPLHHTRALVSDGLRHAGARRACDDEFA
jgi:hypothetical protein